MHLKCLYTIYTNHELVACIGFTSVRVQVLYTEDVHLHETSIYVVEFAFNLFFFFLTGLATVIGIKYESPVRPDSKNATLKVKSFVSDEYKDLVERAARF